MKHHSEGISDPALLQQVKSSSELLLLWDNVEKLLPNCLLALITSDTYAHNTGLDKSKTHYGFVKILPFPVNRPCNESYCASIVLAPDAIESDIGHELMHLYIHGIGYPFIWLDYKYGETFNETPQNKQLGFSLTQIYDNAVHPIIDEQLIERNLFNKKVWSRMSHTYNSEMRAFLKNPAAFSDNSYIILRTIELQHRLPKAQWSLICKGFKANSDFKRLMNKIDKLPTFPDILSPGNVENYVQNMWQHFNLNSDLIKVSLQTQTPLLKIQAHPEE